MDDLAVAQALQVLAVVLWIGGVSLVTLVLLPGIIRNVPSAERPTAIRDDRGPVRVAGAVLDGDFRRHRFLPDPQDGGLGPLPRSLQVVDALDGRRLGGLHACSVRG